MIITARVCTWIKSTENELNQVKKAKKILRIPFFLEDILVFLIFSNSSYVFRCQDLKKGTVMGKWDKILGH